MLHSHFLFPLGRIVATPGALDALQQAGHTAQEFLARHSAGDWGELSAEDRKDNTFALTRSLRLLSTYRLSTRVRIWLITEADRSATAVLLPDEY